MSFLIVNHSQNGKYFVEDIAIQNTCLLALDDLKNIKIFSMKVKVINKNSNVTIIVSIGVNNEQNIKDLILLIQDQIERAVFGVLGSYPKNIKIIVKKRYHNG